MTAEHDVTRTTTAPVAGATAIAVQNISMVFAGRDAVQRVHALDDINLSIRRGEFVCLLGPSGCGKSTLLNLAAGLLAPSGGQVRVFGAPLAGLNRRAGYLFQSDSLMPWRSARDNVAAGPEFAGKPRATARAEADAWLERVGLRGILVGLGAQPQPRAAEVVLSYRGERTGGFSAFELREERRA